jgi:ketosteroid isomerase-like protein
VRCELIKKNAKKIKQLKLMRDNMVLTKEYVAKVFALLEKGDWEGYCENYVDANVQWTITGTNVFSGTYSSRQEFVDKVVSKHKTLLVDSIKMRILHIYVDGDTAIVEMESIATATQKGYPYKNQYLWIHTFRDGKIVEARVYYDDVLVNKVFA